MILVLLFIFPLCEGFLNQLCGSIHFFGSIHLIRAVSVYLAGFVTYFGGSRTYFGVTRAVFNLYVLCGLELIEGKYNNF